MTKSSNDLLTALGQCFWIGLNGTTIDEPSTLEIFRAFQPGGFILFKRNVESLDQVRRFNHDLAKRSSLPVFLAVDQEGGTVERLQDCIGTIPPAMALAATGRHLVRRLHTSHARLLSAMGFNVNFTPVLDLAIGSAGNGLGTRCFSDNPRVVTFDALEVIRAHHEEGVLTCGKHFPGLGDTNLDSHKALPVVPRSWKQILKEDLSPYRALLQELPFIMVNHALYPELNKKLPASLAPQIVGKYLITTLNYPGLAISDDLNMGAVANHLDLSEAAELALRAGNHAFLICTPEGVIKAFKKIMKDALADPKLCSLIFQNASRILAFKLKNLAQPNLEVNPETEIKELEKATVAAAKQSITWIHGEPLSSKIRSFTIYVPNTKWVTKKTSALQKYLLRKGKRSVEYQYPIQLKRKDAVKLAAQSKSEWNIVVVTSASLHRGQRDLIVKLLAAGRKVAVIHGSYPKDVLPDGISTVVASYWTSKEGLTAAADALFGRLKPRGRLPLESGITFG